MRAWSFFLHRFENADTRPLTRLPAYPDQNDQTRILKDSDVRVLFGLAGTIAFIRVFLRIRLHQSRFLRGFSSPKSGGLRQFVSATSYNAKI
ncbi:unnamed protein product [Sphenostylis stenocarpa]|uniref:Uncharacterized protein n=1 Tax=Sphenostylis stenocarpa TaxID=92480 RepID=A0AA87B8E0_9FABA|nr:unnamed protein product [Sphenostylis stenocarpa]